MISAMALWAAPVWFAFKVLQTKEYRYVVIAVFFFVARLISWPFFFDPQLVMGILGLSFAILIGVEQHIKKKIESAPIYILGFIVLGLIFSVSFFVEQLLK